MSDKPCPHCGHCPTCGRGGYVSYPYWSVNPPWQYQPPYQITCTSTNTADSQPSAAGNSTLARY